MATVIHRTSVELRRSVNTPDYDPAEWIIDPDLSAVAGVDAIYWKISGDEVVEMSPAEKDAVDAAILQERKDAAADELNVPLNILRALMLLLLDEMNGHAQKINSILNAVDTASSLAEFKANIAAIADYPTRTEAQLKSAIKNKLGT